MTAPLGTVEHVPPLVPSRGEIDALVRKAARGAGMSWGMAEEIGVAVRQLEAWGVPGLELVLALLLRLDGAVQVLQPAAPLAELASYEGPLCPVAVGTRLIDARHRLGEAPWRLPSLYAPALLLPFACAAAGAGRALALEVDGNRVVCMSEGVHGPVPEGAGGSGPITVCRTAAGVIPRSACPPRPVDAELWAALLMFASRTYVPASDASRLAGAGAGTSDND